MPKLTCLLHTHNDAQWLGRALQSLRPCDEVLVIDANSNDDTEKVARDHGANFKKAIPGVTPGAYAMDAVHEWILCLRPNESLSNDLEAALLEWKEKDVGDDIPCFSVPIRQESEAGSEKLPPEVRLVNRKLMNWIGEMPPPDQACSTVLNGELLAFQEQSVLSSQHSAAQLNAEADDLQLIQAES
jgi:glycosyltransferase involved in cell wall biosynthesis